MSISMKVRGESELTRKFNALSEAAGRAVLITAGLAGGLIVQNDAKVRVPKVTRTLARSIHMEVRE